MSTCQNHVNGFQHLDFDLGYDAPQRLPGRSEGRPRAESRGSLAGRYDLGFSFQQRESDKPLAEPLLVLFVSVRPDEYPEPIATLQYGLTRSKWQQAVASGQIDKDNLLEVARKHLTQDLLAIHRKEPPASALGPVMLSKDSGFTVLRGDWTYTQAKVYDGTGQPGQSIRTGANALDTRCNDCGKEFHATPSRGGVPGKFLPLALGLVQIICPKCKQEGPVSIAELASAPATRPRPSPPAPRG